VILILWGASSSYQCQLAVLDSRSYGSPQNRVRLWIVAARRGLTLPDLPNATHANPSIKATIFSLDGSEARGYYIDSTLQTTPGCGPFPAISVRDAIGDLPPFEYIAWVITSHVIYSADDGSPYTSSRKAKPQVATFSPARSGGDTKVGFVSAIPYRLSPQNNFQDAQRQGSDSCRDHYTPHRSTAEVNLYVHLIESRIC
jgi:site-specific DNA-cytosine methylase